MAVEVGYFGWSGVAMIGAGGVVSVDLFGDAARWEALPVGTTVICLTHGHPEHCGSARALLAQGAPERLVHTYLASSAPVVRHVARDGLLPSGHVHALQAGDRVVVNGVRVTAFAWRHLPLLPPESVRTKAEYVGRLLRRPVQALGIGIQGVRLPMRAPYLGFHVTFADGSTVLNYSEGLHRLTDPDEVAAVAGQLRAETLLLAVEPEDVHAIPRWLEVLRPRQVVLYEAHRPWRELFGLPHVELEDYGAKLRAQFPGMAVDALIHPGQRLEV